MLMKKLGFGLMRLPLLDPNNDAAVDVEEVKRMVDRFMAQGFTYFDTAIMYNGGVSQRVAKAALVDRYPREAFTLATKLHSAYFNSPEERDKVFNEQLEQTGAGYFDYYLIHGIEAGNYPKYEQYDCFNWLMEKKRQGLVRHAGFSFHDTPELLDKILTKYPELEFVQLQINYLDWESANVQSRACYEVCVKHGKPVVVMEPIKGGTLAAVSDEIVNMFKAVRPELSPSAWAVRYAASLENVMVVLSGMSNIAQMEDNASYMENFEPLTKPEYEAIDKAVENIKANVAIPCTACRYCVDGCPMNIAIPDYFRVYNDIKQFGEISGARWHFSEISGENGKPSECVACGQCEGICPQHLQIIDLLKDVAEVFETQKK